MKNQINETLKITLTRGIISTTEREEIEEISCKHPLEIGGTTWIYHDLEIYSTLRSMLVCAFGSQYYTIIDFWWGLLMTMKTASGIGWPTPKAEVNKYLTRSSWSWVDRNQKSIIALLNYREFSFTKIEISIATAFYRAR